MFTIDFIVFGLFDLYLNNPFVYVIYLIGTSFYKYIINKILQQLNIYIKFQNNMVYLNS
jgi:hypothetical protein